MIRLFPNTIIHHRLTSGKFVVGERSMSVQKTQLYPLEMCTMHTPKSDSSAGDALVPPINLRRAGSYAGQFCRH